MKKAQVTYKAGKAFVVSKQTQAIVDCKATAELALVGGVRPNTVDTVALAAGYLELRRQLDARENGC